VCWVSTRSITARVRCCSLHCHHPDLIPLLRTKKFKPIPRTRALPCAHRTPPHHPCSRPPPSALHPLTVPHRAHLHLIPVAQKKITHRVTFAQTPSPVLVPSAVLTTHPIPVVQKKKLHIASPLLGPHHPCSCPTPHSSPSPDPVAFDPITRARTLHCSHLHLIPVWK
jgi:hypothetical protein